MFWGGIGGVSSLFLSLTLFPDAAAHVDAYTVFIEHIYKIRIGILIWWCYTYFSMEKFRGGTWPLGRRFFVIIFRGMDENKLFM